MTVASHNYDKACTLELQSVKLKEAAFAVDELTCQAKVAESDKIRIHGPGWILRTHPEIVSLSKLE